MVDWERFERELGAEPGGSVAAFADRVVASARRRRARRSALLVCVCAALAGAVVLPAVVVSLHDRAAAVGSGVPVATQAAIYRAALARTAAGGSRAQRIVVGSHVCDAVARSAVGADCANAAIPAAVQSLVARTPGRLVSFAGSLRAPLGRHDRYDVRFGTLRVDGRTARLGIEIRCGGWCTEAETLALRFEHGRWRVTGTVGPRWVS